KSTPPNENVQMPADSSPTEKRGLRKKSSSSIGGEQRRSHSTRPVKSINVAANSARVRTDVQPPAAAWMAGYTSNATPDTARTTPSGSKLDAAGLRDSGMAHQPSARTTATSGTLTRKTDPRQNCDSSRPPTTGPNASPMPATAV